MNRGFGIYCFLLNVVTFAIPYGLGWHLSTLQTGWLSARKWTCCAWGRWYDAYLTMLVSRGYVRIDLLSFCLILSLTIVHMLLAFCNLRTSIIFWLVVSAFFRQILHFNPSYNCLMFGSQLTSISFGYLWMVWNHKTIYVYIYIYFESTYSSSLSWLKLPCWICLGYTPFSDTSKSSYLSYLVLQVHKPTSCHWGIYRSRSQTMLEPEDLEEDRYIQIS